ncbi:radical SAM protein [Acetobacterium paludosum]|uniref:Radical SAM protein n=1 Tax=Acetobacterium paludosum TaxID=52693 RepID=A0A923HWX0_9FIRM|nr:radical SAM protein [Acetobacterium paludosum]MBC3888129.1 radical SAM protein [Acetobacterium paludosum]
MEIKRIYIELTNRCNLDCEMCFRHTWDTVEGDINLNLLKSIREQLKELPALEQVFFGGIGEPTVHPQFKEVVELFAEYELLITSNGIMSEDNAKILCEKFSEVYFSADKYHEDTQGVKNQLLQTFERFSDYHKRTRSSTPKVGVAYVLTRSNSAALFDILNMMRHYGFHRLSLSHLMPLAEKDKDDIFYTRYENPEGKAFLEKIFTYRDIKINIPDMELKTERRCAFIDKGYIYINAGGEVMSCYRLANSYDEYVFGSKKRVLKHSFGNVKEKSLKEIIEGKEYQNFWNVVYNNQYPSCVDCDLRGGCSLVEDTKYDCYFNTPSCADCLWVRNFIRCP